jgi:dihydrofolate reductase
MMAVFDLADVRFPRHEPGRGEPKLRRRLSRSLAAATQAQVFLAQQAVADLFINASLAGGRLSVGDATLAGAAMRAGLIDEYALATYPVLVGGGTPFFTSLDSLVNLDLVETRTFPGGVVLTRYETRR